MEPEFWHQRWASHQIGKSVDLRWLADQGAHVIGVELSPIAVESFCAEQGLTPRTSKEGAFAVWESGPIRLLWGDYFALALEDLAGVHAAYDRAALIALPPERRADYVAHLDRLVARCTPHAADHARISPGADAGTAILGAH